MREILLLVLLVGCGGGAAPSNGDDDDVGPDALTGNGTVFDPNIAKVVIEIDYETGQEPFTGQNVGFGDTFDLAAANIDRLFSGTKSITLPRTLGEMEDIGTVADEELTSGDLLALAEQHRGRTDDGETKTYYLIFVSGHFETDEGVQPNVLGVSLGASGVIAMFKDTIRSTDVVGLPQIVRFVEQSTFIHELGHTIGLTDNGVPMVSSHRDAAHGAHCDNDACVMYFLNEGASDAAQFVRDRVLTSDTILFDENCLADVDAQTH